MLVVALALGCGGDATGPNAGHLCTSPQPLSLVVGASVVVDAAQQPCVSLPAAGPGGAEYGVVALSGSAEVRVGGVTAPFRLRARAGDAPPAAATVVARRAAAVVGPASLHDLLRASERRLARVAARAPLMARFGGGPVGVGDRRTFQVLASTSFPNPGFTAVGATAKYVGQKVAIFLDDSVPPGGYTPTDLDSAGVLFDQQMYAIDSTAFGSESDIDGNGRVIVLLTHALNRLSGACSSTGTVVLGFFYGLDLTPAEPHSNGGEIFYGLVPDPTSATCAIPVSYARQNLDPTFIHEFQHMISFHQHVLLRGGAVEDTWLNEGLSHFAEELGGRLLPDEPGSGVTRLTQFALNDVSNAYDYLAAPDESFLVEPDGSFGTFAERGANWLFVRWLLDHFGQDTIATALTRSLLATGAVGAANVEAVTGRDFPTLVTRWQLSNYVASLDSFTDASGMLGYRSWNLKRTWEKLHQQDPGSFLRPYPLVPDTLVRGALDVVGTLRGGSGRFFRLSQAGAGAAVDISLTADGIHAVDPSAKPRIGVVRVR